MRTEVLVIGAGPAGAVAALVAARRGLSVLLVDRAPFPRPKVCGACLNARALERLAAAGLGGLPDRLGAVPLRRLRLAAGGRAAEVPLPEGRAVSRSALDAALVEEAVRAGARFRDSTRAVLGPAGDGARRVRLVDPNGEEVVEARVVLAADGLAGGLLGAGTPARGSRIGAGAVVADAPAAYGPGAIHMAVGRDGYAGLVRVEDGRLNVAAALDPGAVRARGARSRGGPGPAVEEILAEAGLPAVPGLADAAWRGTPALTRRPARVAAERVLALGDAAGYVEPFTGQGIAAALGAALDALPFVEEGLRARRPSIETAWADRRRRAFRDEFRGCGFLARLLRRPALVHAAVGLLGLAPALAAPFIRSTSAPRAASAFAPTAPVRA